MRPIISQRRRGGFSLVELVLVVTILGIVAAIAVPRMTQASKGASANALLMTMESVRTAIDLYYAEHGRYPGYHPATSAPDGTYFVNQLIKFTDLQGNPNDTRSATFAYGPYLRSPFPTNPFNKLSTVHVKSTPADADPADGSAGWVAVLSHGYFYILATQEEIDSTDLFDAAKKLLQNPSLGL